MTLKALHSNFLVIGLALRLLIHCKFSIYVSQSMEKSLWEFQGEANEPLAELDLQSQMLSLGSSLNEPSGCEKEIAVYQERNAALQCMLEDREEEIQKSKAAICAYQEERDKLHRKVSHILKNQVAGYCYYYPNA